MAKQLRTRSVNSEAGLDGPHLIGEGADATVWRSPLERTVRKHYLDDELHARLLRAREEFDALKRASIALSSVPHVTCPTPLDIDAQTGDLLMEYCPGEQLGQAIGDDRFAHDVELENLTGRIAEGMRALTTALPMSQLDFSLRNSLVAEDFSQIIFIDFTSRPKPVLLPEGASSIECALASFLTSAITYQVRRTTLVRTVEGGRLRTVASMLSRSISGDDVSMRRVRQIAWMYYWRQAGNRGWMRYLWFHTAGAVMFRYLLHQTTAT